MDSSLSRHPSFLTFFMAPPPPIKPLELPEILVRISRFVTANDAVVCAQVSKAWSEHFTTAVWHTIDFDVHKNLLKINTAALAKYSPHIRVVKNIKERSHILVLIVSNASKLRRLSVTMSATQEFYANFSDLLRQVNTSIEDIDILQSPGDNAAPFFAVDSIFSMTGTGTTSKLSSLKIQGLTITRDAFSSLLKACPALTCLNIRDTNLSSLPIYDKAGTRCHQHTGLTRLRAPIEQVFKTDQQSSDAPSLFVHFPNLTTWITRKWTTGGSGDVPYKVIRTEIAKHCPSLKKLWTKTPAPMTTGMLSEVFDDLTTVCILTEQFSIEMVMAILNHQESLNAVYTFKSHDNLYDSGEVPEVKNIQLETNGWIIQSIPRRCPELTKLKFPLYEMSMDDIEKAKWKCRDLEELFIRIRGLNTKEKIDRAIQLWKDGRIIIKKIQVNGEQALASTSLQLNSVLSPGDGSIEARVARHLLKFKKLREVWLGWRIEKVA